MDYLFHRLSGSSFVVCASDKPLALAGERQLVFFDYTNVGAFEVVHGLSVKTLVTGGYFGSGSLTIAGDSYESGANRPEEEITVCGLRVGWAGNTLSQQCDLDGRIVKITFTNGSYVLITPGPTATFVWGGHGLLAIERIAAGDGVSMPTGSAENSIPFMALMRG